MIRERVTLLQKFVVSPFSVGTDRRQDIKEENRITNSPTRNTYT